MDACIPLGIDSRWKNNELCYCLRGLEMYSDISDVWVIGDCPDWYIGNHIPAKDAHIPTLSIWNKTFIAAQNIDVSDDFLFLNDDYFFLQPFKAAATPFQYTDVTGNTPYKKIVRHTLDICAKSGLTALNYDVHRPMIFNKAKFIEAYQFFEWHLPIDQGLVMKSCYANLAGVTGTKCNDLKLTQGCDVPDVDMFSISDDIIDPTFKYWCSQRWPEKSRWEK